MIAKYFVVNRKKLRPRLPKALIYLRTQYGTGVILLYRDEFLELITKEQLFIEIPTLTHTHRRTRYTISRRDHTKTGPDNIPLDRTVHRSKHVNCHANKPNTYLMSTLVYETSFLIIQLPLAASKNLIDM